MNEVRSQDLFISYNCFNSCIGTVLRKWYEWGINPVLHLKWQFFYKPAFQYNDDDRFIGEYPAIFDESTLSRINDILSVKINYKRNNVTDISCFERDISVVGAAVILADKYYFQKASGISNPAHLQTTVMLMNICENKQKVSFMNPNQFGDGIIPAFGWIDSKDLVMSCLSEFAGSISNSLRFEFTQIPSAYMDKAACMNVIDVWKVADGIRKAIEDYCIGRNDFGVWHGIAALQQFGDDVQNWALKKGQYFDLSDKNIYQRLIDCSRYLIFVKRQRMLFFDALRELADTGLQKDLPLSEWVVDSDKLLKAWGDLRLLLYLSGVRCQIGAIKNIYNLVNLIKELEYKFIFNMKNTL